MPKITARLGIRNVILDHSADMLLSVGGMGQVVTQLHRHGFRQMFVFRNCGDFFPRQVAKRQAVFQLSA